MHKFPTISIIIVNYNSGLLLASCIDSVRKYTSAYEIVLVDNASTDNSLKMISSGPDLRLFRLRQNVGFARANNIGIKSSSSRYVVLLNSDTIVTPRWLDKLIEKAEKSWNVGVVAPKLLRPGNPPVLDSTGHVYQFQTAMSKDRGHGEPDGGQYDKLVELPSCCFACALIRRAVFQDIGLLDEKMFFYFEDVDFGLRSRVAGWRVVYCPESTVYHLRGGSISRADRSRVTDLSRAYPLRIILKNYQTKNMLRYGGWSFVMALLRTVAGFKNRDWAYVRVYLRVALWNLLHFPIRERMISRRLRRVPDKLLFI